MDECTVSFKEHKLLLEVGVICLDVFFSFRRNLFSFFKILIAKCIYFYTKNE